MNHQGNVKNFEEINFYSFASFILKKKKQLLVFFLIGGLAGVFLTFIMLPKNMGETIIKLGGLPGLSKKYIETPIEADTEIRGGIYGEYQGISVSRIEDSELLRIRIVSSASPSEIESSLSKINQSIIKNHAEILEEWKSAYNEKISDLEKLISMQKAEDKEVENLRLQVFSLDQERDSLIPTRVLLDPVVYKDQKSSLLYGLNFVLGGILGFFILLTYFFIIEWWQKNRAEIKN